MKLCQLFTLSLSLFAATCLAENPQHEINQLLSFIENTACHYQRNGKVHTGTEALKHIKKKYSYYRDEIHSAEDFIRLAATKSTLSGKSYTVHCDNSKQITSQDWLTLELAALRNNKNQANSRKH